ncbi:MAG: thiol peroxidase [Wolinella sp.]
MKHLLSTSLFLSSILFAGTFEENLAKNIAEAARVDAKVISHITLSSLNNLKLALVQTSDGNLFPIYASEDGMSFVGFTPVMKLSDKDSSQVDGMMEELNKLQAKRESEDQVKLVKLFSEIPGDRTLLIKSSSRNAKKTLVIVSDPECPYCKRELDEIEERLKEANIRMIFAPVHDDSAYIKSQLIMNEAKKLKADDSKGRIEIMRKYFGDVKLSETDAKIDFSMIKANAEQIFKSGLIRGVPFVFEQ